MLKFALTIIGLCLLCAEANQNQYPIISRSNIPQGWKDLGRAHHNQPVNFSILLKQQNLWQLESVFEKVSNPKSPEWGQFWSPKQLQSLISADQASFDAVNEWLAPIKNFSKITYLPDSIRVSTTAAGAGVLFRSPLHVFQHETSGKTLARIPSRATIPAHLQKHIDLVVGLSEFFTGKVHTFPSMEFSSSAKNVEGQDLLVTPSLLKQYYNIPSTLAVTNPNNVQGIAAFNDYFSMGALHSFESDQQLPQASVKRIGPDCFPSCDQYESDLDIQYITAMGQGARTIFLNQPNEYWILKFAEDALSLNPLPLVFSLSYGFSELAQCIVAVVNCDTLGYDSEKYVNRTNTALQTLGAAGVSVLVSDGDDGAPNLGAAPGNCPIDLSHWCPLGGCTHTSSQCGGLMIVNQTTGDRCYFPMGLGSIPCSVTLNDPNINDAISQFFGANQQCNLNFENDVSQMPHFYSECPCSSLQEVDADGYAIKGYYFDPANDPPFVADYPTSSPYVTSVGATQFIANDNGDITSEVVCSILTGAVITTGGGFSSFQPMPDYQQSIVGAYINNGQGLPPAFAYNPVMRAYPDIAFNGHHYKIFYSNDSSDQCPCPSMPVDGTSCSAPALSGVISLINDQLLNKGKSQLGFLNYLLYQMYADQPAAFNDIVTGNNNCNRAYCCQYGYQAVAGWDAASGLGTPNFPIMLQYILSKKGISS